MTLTPSMTTPKHTRPVSGSSTSSSSGRSSRACPPPTHDTLNRALQVIPHQGFKRAYQDWSAALLRWNEETRQICIDGKTMRGVKKPSPDTESHIVSAYAPHLQLDLSVGTVPVKRNELDSIRQLLDELYVADALISIDPLGCQRQVAEQGLEVGSHYQLQVNSNQPTLLQELEDSFPRTNKGFTFNKKEDLGHGRIETRQMKSLLLNPEMLEDSYAFKDWAGIKSIHQLSRKRYDKRSGKETIKISYCISSVEDSKRVFRAIRDHWKIENLLHYMLDVTSARTVGAGLQAKGPRIWSYWPRSTSSSCSASRRSSVSPSRTYRCCWPSSTRYSYST